MSGSVNKVIIVGNLGQDPEVRTAGSGMVANLRIATSRSYTDKTGQRQEETEWHTVVLWNKLAELAERYLQKGRKVYIEGRLQTRSWDDQQTGQTRYKTEIVGHQMTFLDGGQSQDQGQGYGRQPQQQRPEPPRRQPQPTGRVHAGAPQYRADDDIPF